MLEMKRLSRFTFACVVACLLSITLLSTDACFADEGEQENGIDSVAVAEQAVEASSSAVEETTSGGVSSSEDAELQDSESSSSDSEQSSELDKSDTLVPDSSDDEAAVEQDEEASSDQETDSSSENSSETEEVIPERTIDDGVYVIDSANNTMQVIDAEGGSTANGTNVQTYSSNMSSAQKWQVTYDEKDGYYTIGIAGTSQVLDVEGASTKSGTNVQLYVYNGTAAQKWLIVKNTDGTYSIFSKLGLNLVIDLKGAGTSDGTNVQVYVSNGSNAQKFYFLSTTVSLDGFTKVTTVEDGSYRIVVGTASSGYVADVVGASTETGANVQLYKSNGTSAQAFYFKKDSDGYYTIYNNKSGLALTASYGSVVPGTNVCQKTYIGVDSQKWMIAENGTGYYLVNVASGLVLDVTGGVLGNGSNIQTYTKNTTAAQRVWLTLIANAAKGEGASIESGVYLIETNTNLVQVVEVDGGITKDGTNVQTYTSNMTNAQKWKITESSTAGYYTIALASNTSKVLDVTGASLAEGTNVQLYTSNGSAAQLWKLVKVQEGVYYFVSALRNDLVLDLTGAGTSNGTNVQVYGANGSNAQKFTLLSTSEIADKSTAEIEAGAYLVVVGSKTGSYVLDIDGASVSAGANLQIYSSNNSGAQRMYIYSDGAGYYVIAVIGSGKVLEVADGNLVPTSNVQQAKLDNTNKQKWALHSNSDGSYYFVNKATRLVLDVTGGILSNGSNVQTYTSNGTKAQKFWLKETSVVTSGIYEIGLINNLGVVLDVVGASTSNTKDTDLQVYTSNDTRAQRYQVIVNDDGSFYIRTASSGGWVTASNSDVVQSGSSKTSKDETNTWKAIWNGSFFSLYNTSTGKVITAAGTTSGSGVSLASAAKSSLQHFVFMAASLISDGLYEINSALGLKLDVAGGSTSAGANVQIYGDTNSNAQKFFIRSSGSGYVITAAVSGYVLDVVDGKTTDGTNVRLWYANGSNAQLWYAQIADGGMLTFVSALSSSKVLDVAGGSATNGANVQLYTANGTNAQSWSIETTTLYGWAMYDGTWCFYYKDGSSKTFSSVAKTAYDKMCNAWSSTKYYICVDRSACHTVIFIGSQGNWEPLYDWICSVGNPNGPDSTYSETFAGVWTINLKSYIEGQCPYQFYWSNFVMDNGGMGQGFHSIQYWGTSPDSAVYSAGLGYPATHGCVRLSLENSAWIYYNCPSGTKVWVY